MALFATAMRVRLLLDSVLLGGRSLSLSSMAHSRVLSSVTGAVGRDWPTRGSELQATGAGEGPGPGGLANQRCAWPIRAAS
ncbi:hypothetical protein E2562_031880 [Oryza meyeriana var. granulata]|uniref:Secreted protein n=1 Tax=Oryza meyeriana var. granulata TaxID=110450 RepID=A0A6G1F076_9ORYZ|nr:hypothetical protein E2562_031880 [Oryza meyeriana var. granulata]